MDALLRFAREVRRARARALVAIVACAASACRPQSSRTEPTAQTEGGALGEAQPCFESMLRFADGGPVASVRCPVGYVCDYAHAVPDGSGRCRKAPP
jgi:hypothetical protein